MRRALALLSLTAACGGPTAAAPSWPTIGGRVAMRETPDSPFREKAPLAESAKVETPPAIVERRLKNGARVLFIERHDVPVISIRVVSDRGSDQADPGIAQFWARAAMRASADHSFWQVMEAWNDLGAEWAAEVSPDSSQLHVRVLSKLFPNAAHLLGELTLKPGFPASQIVATRQRLQAQLTTIYASASGQLSLAIRDHFYPRTHPYHEPYAPPESLAKVTTEILLAYHGYAFTPEHVTLAVAGDATIDVVMSVLEESFGPMTGPKVGAQLPPKSPEEREPDPRVMIIDRPGTQALVAAAWLGPARDDPDRVNLWLAEEEIGSVLFGKLRAELGITYDVHVTSQSKRGRLPLTIESDVEVDRVGDAVREILAAVTRLGKTPVSAGDLELDRSALIGGGRLFESVGETSRTLAHFATYKLPFDWFERRAAQMNAATPEDVRRVFEKWMPATKMMVFVVGDLSIVKPQLVKLGIGAVAWRPAWRVL